MSWLLSLVKHCGPGGFSGTSLGDWLEILCRNRFAVDIPYWPRAAGITCNSVMNSVFRRLEHLRYGRKLARISVPAPLFVLGVWRSGTTHLHNLLAKDDRFAYPTTFDVFYPHTFLCTDWPNRLVMQWLVPSTRPMDNVLYGIHEPQEDEFALAASGLSYMNGLWAFPRHREQYRRFLFLNDTDVREQAAWKAALMQFLRKLTFKYRRTLILKSPPHTSRIKLLLDLFPDAQFVHIHRHPYAVFASTCHTWQMVPPWWRLQRNEIDVDQVIRDYADMYAAYFEQRPLISAQNFCEVAFDDLERDPVGEVLRIYERLRLPDFDYVKPTLQNYIESIAGYSKNRFPDLSTKTRDTLAREWKKCFDEWGYSP
jgi:hypothetical protein